ncbi:MAG: YihY/virulence factor BrkB family protein [Elusimicrobiaceae bacterium]|jgi:membrane protein|nr:YihY/virulence factor BrkB family protein [Elusimicrobiaceae bacterium]MBT3954972.1 YihY/virulence factor BrkB family protein [Elusimicrobiaceae bacterium]MBT4008136.1 YihY/virulence factor BrkB family protein [Elusimicrobiaceae bacterium]MBT4402668.1 YihY/virulence factor BrkB family protein [Elusimicrobiaceae bacterium]MBT4440048.1 YihY/virulence factor BrkB family protein [Elusimicrobiaceae bacterium]
MRKLWLYLAKEYEAFLNFLKFIIRVEEGINKNYCFSMAAEFGFYSLYCIIPFLVFLIMVAGYIPFEGAQQAVTQMQSVLPDYVVDIFFPIVGDILNNPRKLLTILTALLSVFAASATFGGVATYLNRIFGCKEKRPYWKRKLIDMALVLFTVVVIILATMMLIFIPAMFNLLTWGLSILVLNFNLQIIYKFLPNSKQKFKLISFGSIFTLLCWGLVTWGFTIYFTNFSSYNIVYGTMGSIIAFLTWTYLLGFILVLGALINHELDKGYVLKKRPRKLRKKRA